MVLSDPVCSMLFMGKSLPRPKWNKILFRQEKCSILKDFFWNSRSNKMSIAFLQKLLSWLLISNFWKTTSKLKLLTKLSRFLSKILIASIKKIPKMGKIKKRSKLIPGVSLKNIPIDRFCLYPKKSRIIIHYPKCLNQIHKEIRKSCLLLPYKLCLKNS